jgi:hypothetical protein
VTDTVNIGHEDPVLRIQGSPSVRVTATIREAEDTRSFEALGVEVRGGRATLRPATVRVVLRGPLSALKRVSLGALRPYVDLAALSGARLATVALALDAVPAGVRVDRIEPDRVTVTLGGSVGRK